MSIYNPTMWIMKITPGGSGNTKMYFENLFLNEGCKKLIGYTKEDGEIEKFRNRWRKIKMGDLVVVLEGHNRVFGVVEITSDAFDDINETANHSADWFYHRRRAELVKYFNPPLFAKANTNRDTIIEYSGDGAVDICDEVWDKIKDEYIGQKKAKQMKDKLDILRYKKQIILQGPPGTGKTRLAQLMADEMIKAEVKLTPVQYIDWYIKTYKQTSDIKEKNAQRFFLLDEFIQAFPITDIQNFTLESYSMGSGSNDSFCYWLEKKLFSLGRFSPGLAGTTVYGVYFSQEQGKYISTTDESPGARLVEIKKALRELLVNNNNIPAKKIFRQSFILKILSVYFPNDYFPVFSQDHLNKFAKVFAISTSGLDDIQLNQRINERFLEIKASQSSEISSYDFMGHIYDKFNIKGESPNFDEVEVLDTIGEKKLIQFHPAYTYEDFVRGITAETNNKGQVEYKVENKTLAQFAQKALDNVAINYVLIIDEINRANLPSVLGELIYALEYRYNPDKPKENIVESMYALKDGNDTEGDRTLRLPSNLFIIGTMNTADRSVGHIDYAIKRRFAFVNVLPGNTAIDEVVTDPILNKKAKKLYNEVAALFNEDKSSDKPIYLQSDFKANDVKLGHSYFLVTNLAELNMKLNYEIRPILLEYVKDGVLAQDAENKIKSLKIDE